MTTISCRTAIQRRHRRGIVLALISPIVLSSCAAAPFLLPIAFEFARNLIQTGLSNYGSKHRDNLSNLVDRLASPYMQGLPPMSMTSPGAPGQSTFIGQAGFPGQPGMGVQPGFPNQPNMLQQQYPGQQAIAGPTGAYDPNNPYGQQNPYGTTQYSQQNPYGTAQYGQQDPYGQQNPYGTSQYGQQNPYGTGQYGQQNPYGTSQYGQQNSYGTASQYGTPNPYGSQNPYGGAGGYQQAYDPNNPNGQAAYGQTYGQSGYGAPQTYGTQQPSGGSAYGSQLYGSGAIYGRGLSEPVAVDVAMIRQKQTEKGKEIVLMNDGEVLKDGGANKEAGDRFKIVVRTNCDCYIYITSIDGSGWAEPVFPAKDSKVVNPVKKDEEYAFPETGHWYTLDQIKGIESFFVVASANRRPDLEESLAKLAAEKRPNTKIVAKVEEPPVIPRGVGSIKTRGILKVQDETGTAVQVTPLSYAATPPNQDVTVTRWFNHE